jgi:hypothetical protein
MNGRTIMPSEMFGVLNADEAHWQGPWVSPGSSSATMASGGGHSGTNSGLDSGHADDSNDSSEEEHRLHNRSMPGSGMMTGGGVVGGGVVGGGVGSGGGGGGGVDGPPSSVDNVYYNQLTKASVMGGPPPVVGIMPDTPKLTAQTWEATLERSIRSIVSITANHVRSFDTETSGKNEGVFSTFSLAPI